uniref:LPS:glycosyltransferase n=1 Tax=Eubacterium cellulosolvens (strain ATCC 43171 / JCM 9499 / 6) TaxID=633697 RepID=I5AQ91_EUBC6
MNIMVSFNDAYVFPTKVMLKSLILNNMCSYIYIYIVYTDLSEESMNSIKELEDGKRIFISFVPFDSQFVDNFPLTMYFSKEAYIRLFAQWILDDCLERILWLDGDIIINGSLEEFYSQEFDGKIYVAEKDMGKAIIKARERLGMPLDSCYVNSGVLLIDLAEARKKIDRTKIVRYIEEHSMALLYVDQDVLNGCLNDMIKVSDTSNTYNYLTQNIESKNKTSIYKNVRVFHYVGPSKPWKNGYRNSAFRLWWKYALITDGSRKETFVKLLPSCLYGKTEHAIALFLARRCKSLFKVMCRVKFGNSYNLTK